MGTKNIMAAVGLVALLTLTGAGCKDLTQKPGGPAAEESTEKTDNGSAKDAYNKAANLDISGDAEGRTSIIQEIVEDQFGDVKISSFLAGFPSPDSVTMEFTAKRNAEAKDLNAMVNALKKKGYEIEFSGVADGASSIAAKNKKDYVMITFEVGQPKIGGWVTSAEEIDQYADEE